MSDDLVEQLRLIGTRVGVINRMKDAIAGREGADRIEQLEAANLKASLITVDHLSRIETLEAALRKIGEGDVCVSLMTHPAQCGRAYQARKALEGKDG